MMKLSPINNELNKNIKRIKCLSISELVRYEDYLSRVGVFGGDTVKRLEVVMYCIARCFGRVSIISISNNDSITKLLKAIPYYFPGIVNQFSQTRVGFINKNECLYEPFSGMRSERIVEILYGGYSDNSNMASDIHVFADVLMRYLGVMEICSIAPSLTTIVDLVNRPLNELDAMIRLKKNDEYADELIKTLSRDGAAMRVRADLNHFASVMQGRIWEKKNDPGSLSILNAVKKQAILSIEIPSGCNDVLDYLGKELRVATESGDNILLIVSDINVGSGYIYDLLHEPDDNLLYTVSAEDASVLNVSKQEAGFDVMYKMDQIVLMKCFYPEIARQYSEKAGEYMRVFTSENRGKQKGPFDLIAGHGSGVSYSEQKYYRISPEEFLMLNDGAFIFDKLRHSTVKVDKLVGNL